jgi:hypothetical protein
VINARTLWVLAIALAGCYGSRSPDEEDGLTGNGVFSERAGQPAPGTAGKAGDPKPGAAGKSGGAGGKGGSATCAAIRRDPTSPEGSEFDTAAFSGIGGAGAMLASACKRCGWKSSGDACQELVYTVPTITDPLYGPCVTASIDFASCLERESCICDGSAPAACTSAKKTLDQCLNTGMSSNDVSTPPPQWISVDTQCGYVFKAPPDYVDQSFQGRSSCSLGFAAGDCVYSTGYGSFTGLPDPPGNASDVIKRQVRIDGYDATLLTYSGNSSAFLAHVWFPKLPNGVGLQMGAICRSSAGPYEASMLYRSLHFAF